MNYRRVFIKNGLVFLTIVTNDRIPILTDNIKLLNQSYNNVIKYYKFDLIAYSILPEHIHCIIKPTIIEEYSKIVKDYEAYRNNILEKEAWHIGDLAKKIYQYSSSIWKF